MGYLLVWGLTIFITYPFLLHNPGSPFDPKYDIARIGPKLGEIVIFSRRCKGTVDVQGHSCGPCSTLDVEVACVRDWVARRSDKVQEQKEAEKKDRLGLLRKEALLEVLEKIISILRDNEVPAVHRLLRASHNRGESVDALLNRVQAAANGTYRPCNYTDTDYDLAAYLYECGGSAALQCVATSSFVFRPPVSVSAITSRTLRCIFALAKKRVQARLARPPRRRVGVSLGIDETAGQGSPCYLPTTDELGGMCLEHFAQLLAESGSAALGEHLTDAMAIAQAVREGKVHVGKEFTCAAISVLSEEGYSAKPIHLSATCKQGDVCHSARLLLLCIEAWKRSEWGESYVGPLWAISSDGDATRRAAMYMICMEKELSMDSGLYQRLHRCQGLNLFVGEGDITMDFDYRHIWKGICTLLCSKEGMLANEITVNKQLLAVWLPKLTQYDWSDVSIHALLNPKDPQDVPRAVMLLKRVAELRNLDTTSFSPADRVIHQALSLVGEAIHSLIEPFTNPALSLSAQITHIIKAAHLFAALYKRHYTSFMSNQLYGDLQCMLKTAIFNTAKTQELDPALKVFLCLLGDNGVETLFGRVRMKGKHAPNMEISEFESCLR
ncbi:hypothetical protein FB107DRAFT_279674 [Schizophyllum commune]